MDGKGGAKIMHARLIACSVMAGDSREPSKSLKALAENASLDGAAVSVRKEIYASVSNDRPVPLGPCFPVQSRRNSGPHRLLIFPPFRPACSLRSANSSDCGGGQLASFPRNNRNDLPTFNFGPPGALCGSDPRTTSRGHCPTARAACPGECGDLLVELFKSSREAAALLL